MTVVGGLHHLTGYSGTDLFAAYYQRDLCHSAALCRQLILKQFSLTASGHVRENLFILWFTESVNGIVHGCLFYEINIQGVDKFGVP